ncbi:MAG: response regulator [Nitrospiraceae bacterium]
MRGGRRILMVDNDPVILEAVADMLSAKDYQVTKARDGLEALERFRDGQYDVAIIDIVLPKIDGHDLCRLIRQEERGRLLPIIAFTALAPQDVAKLPGLSADAYVAKGPLTVIVPNILDAIKSMLTRSPRRLKEQRIFGYEGFRPRQIVSELFQAKQYYQRLLHSIAEVVIELDAHARIISANLEALRLLGRPEAEVTGLPFSELLAPRDRAAFQAFLAQLSEDPSGTPAASELTLPGTRHRLRCRPVLDNRQIEAFLVTAAP